MLWASIAVVHTGAAQKRHQRAPGYGYMQAQIGHRQSIRYNVNKIEKDNEQLDLPASRDSIIGADQENALAKTIKQENARLDRELRGICRGC